MVFFVFVFLSVIFETAVENWGLKAMGVVNVFWCLCVIYGKQLRAKQLYFMKKDHLATPFINQPDV